MARYQVGIRTERKILEATRELLAEGGLDAVTLKAICDRAGVQAGSFYNIFPSKEQAIMQVAREAIQAVDPDPDPHPNPARSGTPALPLEPLYRLRSAAEGRAP